MAKALVQINIFVNLETGVAVEKTELGISFLKEGHTITVAIFFRENENSCF